MDYYETITDRMPGVVLRKHGLVSRDGDGYALAPHLHELSAAERTDLVRLCDDAIVAYKTKRGAAIWEHRAIGLGQIPGGLGYDTLKRAAFRCELCGVSAHERALDVDDIIPRKHGGTDDPDFLNVPWDRLDIRTLEAFVARANQGKIWRLRVAIRRGLLISGG